VTVNNSQNKIVAAGNGVQTMFGFSFIAVDASDSIPRHLPLSPMRL
jgi:hypothetical protein